MSSESRPVLDASAVLALIQGETGSERLAELLPQAVVSAVNMAEVLAKLVGRGMPRSEASVAFDALHVETAAFEPMEAALSASYVGKGISLGDRCFLAATYLRGTGWTSDRALASLPGALLPKIEFFR